MIAMSNVGTAYAANNLARCNIPKTVRFLRAVSNYYYFYYYLWLNLYVNKKKNAKNIRRNYCSPSRRDVGCSPQTPLRSLTVRRRRSASARPGSAVASCVPFDEFRYLFDSNTEKLAQTVLRDREFTKRIRPWKYRIYLLIFFFNVGHNSTGKIQLQINYNYKLTYKYSL